MGFPRWVEPALLAPSWRGTVGKAKDTDQAEVQGWGPECLSPCSLPRDVPCQGLQWPCYTEQKQTCAPSACCPAPPASQSHPHPLRLPWAPPRPLCVSTPGPLHKLLLPPPSFICSPPQSSSRHPEPTSVPLAFKPEPLTNAGVPPVSGALRGAVCYCPACGHSLFHCGCEGG